MKWELLAILRAFTFQLWICSASFIIWLYLFMNLGHSVFLLTNKWWLMTGRYPLRGKGNMQYGYLSPSPKESVMNSGKCNALRTRKPTEVIHWRTAKLKTNRQTTVGHVEPFLRERQWSSNYNLYKKDWNVIYYHKYLNMSEIKWL